MKQRLSMWLFGCFCVLGCNKPDDRVVKTEPVSPASPNVVADKKGIAPQDSKANDTKRSKLPPDKEQSEIDKPATPFPKVSPKFASLSVKASFLPVAMGKKALTEVEVNESLHKIAQFGMGVYAIKKDDKGRITSCIIVGESVIDTILGKNKCEVARLRARHFALAAFNRWISVKVALDGSNKLVSTSEHPLPVLELLHAEVNAKDKLYTILFGWDAKVQGGYRPKLKVSEWAEDVSPEKGKTISTRRVMTCTLSSADSTASVLDPEFTIARTKDGNYSLSRLTVAWMDNEVSLLYEEYGKRGVIEQARKDDVGVVFPKSRFGKGIVLVVDGVDQADIARKWSSMVKGQLPKKGVAIADLDGRSLSLDTITKETFNEFAMLVKTKIGLELRLENMK